MANADPQLRLRFHGGAGTVTGSCIEVASPSARILVDCGLFQGPRAVTDLNRQPFRFRPKDVDAVLVTHAHIDRVGLLPRLVREGFDRAIHVTAPTADLMAFVLPDSAAIQESEAERYATRRRRRGQPALAPIYTGEDAERTLRLLRRVELDEWLDVVPGMRARWWNAGHMLGSTSIELSVDLGHGARPLTILFSGDLGPDEKMFHPPPEAPEGADVVVCESTYGDRDREDVTLAERSARLAAEIRTAQAAGGNVLIPAFAVERTQELVTDLLAIMRRGEVDEATIYIDSPLASRATQVFRAHAHDLEDLPDADALFDHPRLRIVRTVDESRALNEVHGGAIIVAASGMCDAGRIRHHLKHNLWRPEATVLFVGYQAPGTLGAILQSGAPSVRIHGAEIAVRARLRSLPHYSAHADRPELVRWVLERQPIRQALLLNHGEDAARAGLAAALEAAGFDRTLIRMPDLDAVYDLSLDRPLQPEPVVPRVPAPARLWDAANAQARFLLELDARLDAMPDDAAKRRLLERLEAALAA